MPHVIVIIPGKTLISLIPILITPQGKVEIFTTVPIPILTLRDGNSLIIPIIPDLQLVLDLIQLPQITGKDELSSCDFPST